MSSISQLIQDLDQITLDQFHDATGGTPLKSLRDEYFKAAPEVCVERSRLLTEYHQNNNLFEKMDRGTLSILDKAKAYHHVLKYRDAVVRHNKGYERVTPGQAFDEFPIHDFSPFAGSTTSKFKGVLLYPELVALTMWPELQTMERRRQNPFRIGEEEIESLNYDIFPRWIEHNLLELTRKRLGFDNRELRLLQNIVFYLTSKPLCISHTIPDFSRAVGEGLDKIIGDAQTRHDSSADPGKKVFYSAIIEVLTGILDYADNLANKAQVLADDPETSLIEKGRLLEIAQRYRTVPKNAAGTFKEGLTTVWLCWTALHLENPNVGLSLGRLDQLLYPLYKKDIDAGTLTVEEAVELVCYLWLKIGDHVPTMTETAEQLFGGTGSNQAVTIGGVDKNENDAVNDLTYVMLRATELMGLRDPNLNARYYPGKNTPEYLRRVCQANLDVRAKPAIHNDHVIIKALTSKGDPVQHARNYGVVGCVEPSSHGAYGHSAAILLNLPAVLELALYNGKHRHIGVKLDDPCISIQTGDPSTFETFDQFRDAFKAQTLWLVDSATRLNNEFGKSHQQYYPTPIMSAFFDGPMEHGMDVVRGGATINSSGVAIIGLADVVDSLSAIEGVVYAANPAVRISFPDVLQALDKNFLGADALHKRLMNSPKYGTEKPGYSPLKEWSADKNASFVVDLLDHAFSQKANYRGGTYRVGYWTMTIHAAFGLLTKALPNGRKDKESFASGITPVSTAPRALTEALNSTAKLPASALSSGVALNLKYVPEPDPITMLDNFTAAVQGYFDDDEGQRDGGMEIQFNVVGREDLEKLARDPTQVPDPYLLVRVSGYTAYFKDLNAQMQKEIIERTEYRLSTGNAIPFQPYNPTETGLNYEPWVVPLTKNSFRSALTNALPAVARPVVSEVTERLEASVTDSLLLFLLNMMEIAFDIAPLFVLGGPLQDYHKQIQGFDACYLFETQDGVHTYATFHDGSMDVPATDPDSWNVRITFKSEHDLLRFLLKRGQGDVLDQVLGNKVEVSGNLNYLFKFGFMARDLLKRIGLY